MSVALHPSSSLGFHRPLTQETKTSLIITNCNALPIAFKVLTNAGLHSYVVRPNLGRVEPGQSVEIDVLLQAKKEEPPLGAKCKDKFLIKSTTITGEREKIALTDLWAAPKSTDEATKVHQQKLTVVYLPPAKGRSSPETQQSSVHTTDQALTNGIHEPAKASKETVRQTSKQEGQRPATVYSEYSIAGRESRSYHSYDVLLDVVGKLACIHFCDVNAVRLIAASQQRSEVQLSIRKSGIMLNMESFLDFLLEQLCNNGLKHLGVPDANQKARKLIFKLISMTSVLPRSLFLAPVEIGIGIGAVAVGQVLKGRYRGRPVSLKVLSTGRHQESSFRIDLCKEALNWKSVSHRFVLPSLGIYEEKSLLFHVYPFMPGGTLTQWRKDKGVKPDVLEIHRLISEVAEAVQYLHSEGIFHGDLYGETILLDSELHCQIADFGSSRYSACRSECDERHEPHKCKTMKMDVYAFGCLYYAIFFDAVPFQGKNESQVRPDRLRSPRMEDETWNLIQGCWRPKPLERPTMEEIVKASTQRPKPRRLSLMTKISSRFLRL